MSCPSILLAGLDGSNPLAFLAALGTLRTLNLALPVEVIRISWEENKNQGIWSPRIYCCLAGDAEKFISAIQKQLQRSKSRPAFDIGDNLNLPWRKFHEILQQATTNVAGMQVRDGRIDADFFAAFGSDAIADENGVMEDTALRTMSGAGHQHFLKFFRDLVIQTNESHIERALLHRWDYADEGRGLALRWDPSEDRRYALRWDNPSGDPVKTMRGANRLAIEALPLFPTMPTSKGLATTAFQGSGRRGTYFIWPIWSVPIESHVVGSLLGQVASVKEDVPARAGRCVTAIYSSARITTGKFRNFTPATSV